MVAETVIVPDEVSAIAILAMLSATPHAGKVNKLLFIFLLHNKISLARC
jgi:hypothetical protein